MSQKFIDYLHPILCAFDSIDLDCEYRRRVAVKPLYDYFQRLILEVAVRHCSMNRNTLQNCHLKTRWDMIKSALALVEDPMKWDQLVKSLHNMRSSTEHYDYNTPKKQALVSIRKKAPEFADWILKIGKKYLEESKGFSFVEKFSLLANWYIRQTDWTLNLYGEEPPYSVESDYVPLGEDHPYCRLKSLRDCLRSRIFEISRVDDLTKEDLDTLVELIKEIERLDAKETILLKYSVCPKCGEKIVDTQTPVGGSSDDPEPSAIIWRVGCENCDYVINSETINV